MLSSDDLSQQMDGIEAAVHSDLRNLLVDLGRVQESINAYNPRSRPPVLDSSVDPLPSQSQAGLIPGIRPFLESVVRDMDVLSKVL
jgi:hypothetical protein